MINDRRFSSTSTNMLEMALSGDEVENRTIAQEKYRGIRCIFMK
jgi:hypothetical protein